MNLEVEYKDSIYLIKPDQISFVNSLAVLLFSLVVGRVKISRPSKIVVGMFLATISFFLAGVVQSKIMMNEYETSVNIIWQIPQYVLMGLAETLIVIPGLEMVFCVAFSMRDSQLTIKLYTAWWFIRALANIIVLLWTFHVYYQNFYIKIMAFEFYSWAGIMFLGSLFFIIQTRVPISQNDEIKID
jgi:dipeptide/tripeptide permease